MASILKPLLTDTPIRRKLQLAETSAMCDVVEERTGEENPEQYKYRVMSR